MKKKKKTQNLIIDQMKIVQNKLFFNKIRTFLKLEAYKTLSQNLAMTVIQFEHFIVRPSRIVVHLN